MAQAIAPALLAVPDRPLAERPETKGSDGSDGRFAGLMAQFVPASAPTQTSVALQDGSAKEEQAAGVNSLEAQAASNPAPSDTQANPSGPLAPMHREALAGTPEVPPGAVVPPAPGPSPEGLVSAGAEAGTDAGMANPGPQTPPFGAIPAPPPANPTWTQLQGTALPSSESEAPALPVEAAPNVDLPPPALAQVAAGTSVTFLATPSTTPATIPAMTSASGGGGAPPPASVTAIVPAKPEAGGIQDPRVSPPAAPTPDPLLSPVPALVQAVRAEFKPGLNETPEADPQAINTLPSPADSPLPEMKPTKETPSLERTVAAPMASPIESPQPALKARRADEAPTPSLPLSPGPIKPPWHATAPVIGPATARNGSAESAEGPIPAPARSESTSVGPDSTPMAPDSPVPKAGHSIQPAVSHGPDGSPLAALGALPRAAGSPQAPVAQAPLAAAPPPSAPMTQVEGGLRWMLKGGTQEARLQLHPESLGQVTIHLKVEGGEVHARLWITEAASVKAVQEGRPHLEMALKEQGLQLGSFDLQQGQRPFREAPSPSPFRQHTAPEAHPARQEAPASAPLSILNPHRVELYA